MDTLSHALLGAAIGQCTLGQRTGNRALAAGAMVALIPDIDVAIGHWLGDAAALTFHRGITHSLLFTALAALVLGPSLRRLIRADDIAWWHWTLLSALVLTSHLALDTFTSYGIQLLQPFSTHSFAIASISVIDPLYTLPLLVAMAVVPWLARQQPGRNLIAITGLLLSTLYLAMTLVNKQLVEAQFRQGLTAAGIAPQRLFVKPTIFNNLLWRGIAENDSGYLVGFFSLRDSEPPQDFIAFSRNAELLHDYRDTPLVHDLLRVSDGYYQVIEENGELLFRDLRYGQAFEWLQDDRPHVFTYRLVIENGALMDLETLTLRVDKERDQKTFKALLARALGADI
ncbi:MAG: metal-dependent hydrolase [Porticoccaceae bacterium]|nr:metal-dependent hydrolase [Porticoccaceae bacterium]